MTAMSPPLDRLRTTSRLPFSDVPAAADHRHVASAPGPRAHSAAPSAECTALDGEQTATLVLSNIEGIGPATLRAIRAAFRSLAQALQAPRAAILPLLKVERARQAFLAVPNFADRAHALIEQLRAANVRILFPSDAGWPVQLRTADGPPLLYVRGHLDPSQPRLAVVGARAADDYGRAATRFWAGEPARKGIAIVSGGARGVDSQAHCAALDAGGTTIAVLGTGIDQIYPPENAALFERIVASGGALISQFPLGTPPIRPNFILRNFLIAALCEATLVTRAGPDSGALSTARAARQMSRAVFALPGDLSSKLSWGTQQLVEAGIARSISGIEPIGCLMRVSGPWPSFHPNLSGRSCDGRARPSHAPASAPRRNPGARLPCDHLPPSDADALAGSAGHPSASAGVPSPPLEEKILNVFKELSAFPRQFDELLAHSDLDAAGLADALLRLELLGLCQEQPGRFFRRTAPD